MSERMRKNEIKRYRGWKEREIKNKKERESVGSRQRETEREREGEKQREREIESHWTLRFESMVRIGGCPPRMGCVG